MKKALLIILTMCILLSCISGFGIINAEEDITVVSIAATSELLTVVYNVDPLETPVISITDAMDEPILFESGNIVTSGRTTEIKITDKIALDEIFGLKITIGATEIYNNYIRINVVFEDDGTGTFFSEKWSGTGLDCGTYENGKIKLTNGASGGEVNMQPKNIISSGNQTVEFSVTPSDNMYDVMVFMMSQNTSYSGNYANLFYGLSRVSPSNIRVKSLQYNSAAYTNIPIPNGTVMNKDIEHKFASTVSGGILNIYRDGKKLVDGLTDLDAMTMPSEGLVNFRVVLAENQVMLFDDIKVLSVEEGISVDRIPIAKNLTITKIDDTHLRGDYDFFVKDPTVTESGTVLKWYFKDIGDDEWSEIIGENEKDIDITPFMDKMIKFEVFPNTPQNDNTKYKYFTVYTPPFPPEATDIVILGELVPGSVLKADYKYTDVNGDEEDKNTTEIVWMISENPVSDYIDVVSDVKDEYSLTENDLGKYVKLRITPVNVNGERGLTAESDYVYISPLIAVESATILGNSINIDLLSAAGENLKVYLNGEEVMPVTDGNSIKIISDKITDYNVIKIEEEKRYSYLNITRNILFRDDFEEDIDGWECDVEKAFSYDAENKSMILAKNVSKPIYYNGSDFTKTSQLDLANYYLSYDILNSSPNIRLFSDVRSDFANGGYRATVREFGNGMFYLCGLYPAVTSISYDALNDKSDTHFNYYDKLTMPCNVIVSVQNDSQKVYMNTVEGYSANYTSAAQGGFYFTTTGSPNDIRIDNVCLYNIDYVSSSAIPVIENARITGTFGENQTIEADFDSVGLSDENTRYVWYQSDSFDGTYTKIDGANKKTFFIAPEYKDKFIYCEIIPYNSNGVYGLKKTTPVITKPYPPEARNVNITKNPLVGSDCILKYEYFDINYDAQSEVKIKWLISSNLTDGFEIIPQNDTDTLKIEDAYQGKYIKAVVTPKATVDPVGDTEFESNTEYIYYKPYIKNLTIKNVGNNVLTADYEFVSPDNIQQGNTKFEWFLNGSPCGTTQSISVSGISRANVEVKVTPYLYSPNLAGNSMTATTIFTKKLSGGGNYGASGLGTVTEELIKIDEALVPPKTSKFTDLTNHWAADYAERAVEKGIMTGTDNMNFYPDLKITRAEFVVYLLKTLSLSDESYSGPFKDVDTSDWFAGFIQTALNKNIISEDETFNPYTPVTREQICKMLALALGLKADKNNQITSFEDDFEISDWARVYVNAVCDADLMSGTDKTVFSPKTTFDRAQMSALIAKILDYMEKEE